MKFWLTLFLACSMLFLNGCSSDKKKKADDNQSAKAKDEIKHEKIVLQDVSGKEIVVTSLEKGFSFAGFENKVVLVNFFTTWCPPCKAEIPHLNSLQEKYKDNFVIISVLLEENKSNEEISNFIKYNNINYVITNTVENFKGKYSTHYVGAIPEEMIDADIKKVL